MQQQKPLEGAQLVIMTIALSLAGAGLHHC